MQQSRYLFGYVNLRFILFFVIIFAIIIPLLLRESFADAQAAQARCINYRECRSDTVLHITNDLKTLYEKFNIVVKP